MESDLSHQSVSTLPCHECYVCGSQAEALYSGVEDRLFNAPGRWNLVRCLNPDCGLVWLDPMPAVEDIGKLYTDYYTHGAVQAGGEPPVHQSVWVRAARALYDAALWCSGLAARRRRMSMLFLDREEPGSILDVGCGDGSRLLRFRDRGWKVHGQDVDPKAAEQARARGVQVHVGALAEFGLPDQSMDAVIIYHVIEHVPDPAAVLRECYRVLKPGGMLALATPNIESAGHRRFGMAWRDLDPPRHLHLFSTRALAATVLDAGFGVHEVWTTSVHAASISRGSLDIRDSGRHDMATATRFDRNLVISLLFYQPWLSLRSALGSNLGEECVLRARRP